MLNRLLPRIERSEFPRLTLLVVIGALLLAVGGGLVGADPMVEPDVGLLGIRIGVIGFLLFVFGGAGYIAITVFERRPEA